MKVFYGWRIVAAGAGCMFLSSALLLQAFGAYVAVLSEEFGWSKTALAGGAALQSIEGALLGPALGWMVDRFGPRVLVQGGVLALAAGFLALSQVSTMTGFYGAIALLAVGTSFVGYFPFSVTVMHWFERWRARALSLMGLGLAAGGITMPLVGWAMQTFGWRKTALASAVIVLLVGYPLARIVRRNPAEMGETIDGVPPPAQAEPAAADAAPATSGGPGFSLGEALRTPAFWLLGLGHAFALLVVNAVNVHALSHMKEDLGYSLAQGSLFITLMTLSQAGGVLLGAAMGDRWNKRLVAAGCMLAHMIGLLMLTYAVHPSMLVLFAILHGAAWGLRGPFMQALRADYFGLQAIGMIMGVSAVLISTGQVSGPLLAGLFVDLTGNYRAGFTVIALIAGSGCLLFMLARKPRRRPVSVQAEARA
ncbi:MAG TPA: MFS transporter [Ramlibacter sp.]|nr:MFS transporter [Ramlibacter sp.]